MIQSIRTYLIFNLLLSVTLILSLAIIGNLFLEHRNMQKRLDTQLAYTALHIESFVSASASAKELERIQGLIDDIPKRTNTVLPFKEENVVKKIVYPKFQIWRNNDLLLKSGSLPSHYIGSQNTAFITKLVDGIKWRIFTTMIPHRAIKVVVAENYDLQEQLEGRITQSSVLMMIISYPILALFIWLIVGKGLKSIGQVTREIRQRDSYFLEPIPVHLAPIEVQPFIEELNTLLDTLESTLLREKRFASDAAHELRTPLAALRTQTALAKQAKSPNDQKEAFEKIIKSIDRSSHIIEQLLALSRAGPEVTLEGKSKVNLVRLATDLIAELYPSALEKNTEVALIYDQEPIYILAHSAAIGMLMRNLVDNAIKYTPRDSSVEVMISQNAESTCLKVIDNGNGIPEALRERVFERFFRGIEETMSGCGLGLGIVNQVVTLHNAHIELNTPPSGKGLEVKVNFPEPS